MSNEDTTSEIRLMAEIHIPDSVRANRIDVYDWIVGLISDWASAAPNERVTTSPELHPDGQEKHNRCMVIDMIESNEDIGKVVARQRK